MNTDVPQEPQGSDGPNFNSGKQESTPPPLPTQGPSPGPSEIDWLRGIMAEAPWLFSQKDSERRIPAYSLPGAEEHPPERPVPDPRLLLRQLTDYAVSGQGLEQRISEYVQRVVSITDIPHEARTTHLAMESGRAMSLATNMAVAFSRANTCAQKSAAEVRWQLAEGGLSVVREFAALAKEGNHDAVFSLIEIAEAAIAGLEKGGPQAEVIIRIIAPSKEQWPQICGALPEDRDRVQARLLELGVGTKTTMRKTYGGRGRPISYDPSKTPVNAVAESILRYIYGLRYSCALHAGGEWESAISAHLLSEIASLPELDAGSVKEWVRVAEEIVKECCGIDLEGIPGLVSDEAHRNYERRRSAGDELFESDIRDNVRASLVQAFRTIARPGAK